MITDKRLEEIQKYLIWNQGEFVTPTKELFEKSEIFFQNFVRVRDNSGYNWMNQDGELLSNKRYVYTGSFFNNRAQFTDNSGNNWVNLNGEELSDKRYFDVGNFYGNFAIFEGEKVKGFVNYLGLEFNSKLFKFTDNSSLDIQYNAPILGYMESEYFKRFPKDSLKRFIFEEII